MSVCAVPDSLFAASLLLPTVDLQATDSENANSFGKYFIIATFFGKLT